MTGLNYSAHRTSLSARAPMRYTVHKAGCPHEAITPKTDFGRIENLRAKIAIGIVKPCGHCRPDLKELTR